MFNFIKTIFNGFGNILLWFLKKWRISFTLISIIVLFFSAIVSSIEMKSPLPFVDAIGGKIVRADNAIYEKTIEMKQSTSKLSIIKALSHIGYELWAILFVCLVIYFLVSMQDKSEILKNLMYSFIVIFILQLCFNFYILSDSTTPHTFVEKAKLVVPFKGIISFLSVLPNINSQIIDSNVINYVTP